MDKNLLLAVSLSIAVYAVWFGFIEKRFSPLPPRPAIGAPARPSQDGAATSPSAAPSGPSSMSSPAEKQKQDASVISKSYAATLGTAQAMIRPEGAAVASYKEQEPLGVVELIQDPEPGFLATFANLKFSEIAGAAQPSFEAKSGPLKIKKEFLPGSDDALPRLRISATNTSKAPAATGDWTLSVGPGLGTIATELKENPKNLRAVGLMKSEGGGLNDKLETFKSGESRPNNFTWVGVDNRYFLAAAAPKPDEFHSVAAQGLRLDLTAKSETLAPGQTRVWEIPYYCGAKSQTILARYNIGLERAINFGFFAQLGRFILKVLFKLHGFTGNWGWSIILLTILLQLCLFPLTYKSLKATMAMKRLQPEIAKLQQRHGKDPQKLNAEMMELYKKEGANPLGGCLPMVLQMPIFVALFNALRNAWELHGAGWMFWIKDLSAKDPYYVLPIVMGGLMFAQNKLNPPSADPAQQQMMTFMPIIFTVMFMNFPSGLVLYWLTNSLVSTTQQLLLKNHLQGASRR
jgi:YidC/Oxa1 family membrane protein insertase